MITIHNIQAIQFENDNLVLVVDGREIEVPLEKVSTKLKNANQFQRNLYKITPSGYGVHWPLIDEGLSIDGLIKIAS